MEAVSRSKVSLNGVPMVFMAISVPERLKRQLEARSRRERKPNGKRASLSHVVRQMLEQALRRQG